MVKKLYLFSLLGSVCFSVQSPLSAMEDYTDNQRMHVAFVLIPMEPEYEVCPHVKSEVFPPYEKKVDQMISTLSVDLNGFIETQKKMIQTFEKLSQKKIVEAQKKFKEICGVSPSSTKDLTKTVYIKEQINYINEYIKEVVRTSEELQVNLGNISDQLYQFPRNAIGAIRN